MTSIFDSLGSLCQSSPSHPQSLHGSSTLNPLHALSEQDNQRARSLFLTLHVLFPHELLPALDLLDRGLVTRLITLEAPEVCATGIIDSHFVSEPTESSSGPSGSASAPLSAGHQTLEGQEPNHFRDEVFYIQSSSASSSSSAAATSHHRKQTSSGAAPFYEVRLDSWNCTCPAFSVSAFHSLMMKGHYETKTEAEPVPAGPPHRWTNNQGKGESKSSTWRFGGVAVDTASTSSPRPPSCKHILAAVLAKAAPGLFAHGVTSRTVSRDESVGWGAGWGEFGGG
ncbi:hypothetical protein PV08_08076 [Exophiala spinifera]|uniref:SWIM-type domain-containing protein n=1 Tax=Exophiala spinifera TaxID=91928 RepID=A0A0D2BP62_9EURO|nr:uncharacterized protein PV08_08076 [Exophiala spinifera]KIW12889.1 hypothetical protein PV08_08076 [Exophiala spinifera]